jgi:hypothetical protein
MLQQREQSVDSEKSSRFMAEASQSLVRADARPTTDTRLSWTAITV